MGVLCELMWGGVWAFGFVYLISNYSGFGHLEWSFVRSLGLREYWCGTSTVMTFRRVCTT